TDVPFWQIATGFIIAAATLIKPTFLLPVALLPLHGILMSRAPQIDWRRVFQHGAIVGAAAVLGVGIAFSGLVISGTTIEQFWESAIEFNTGAYGTDRTPPIAILQLIFQSLIGAWWWITLAAVFLPLWFLAGPIGRQQKAVEAYLLILILLGTSIVS